MIEVSVSASGLGPLIPHACSRACGTYLAVMSTATPSAATASPLPAPRDPKLRRMANGIRALAMDAVEQAQSGHPGMPMGMADVAAVLLSHVLRFDPHPPGWPHPGRLALSPRPRPMLPPPLF